MIRSLAVAAEVVDIADGEIHMAVHGMIGVIGVGDVAGECLKPFVRQGVADEKVLISLVIVLEQHNIGFFGGLEGFVFALGTLAVKEPLVDFLIADALVCGARVGAAVGVVGIGGDQRLEVLLGGVLFQ